MTYYRLLEPRMECLDLRYPKLKVADHYWVWRGGDVFKSGTVLFGRLETKCPLWKSNLLRIESPLVGHKVSQHQFHVHASFLVRNLFDKFQWVGAHASSQPTLDGAVVCIVGGNRQYKLAVIPMKKVPQENSSKRDIELRIVEIIGALQLEPEAASGDRRHLWNKLHQTKRIGVASCEGVKKRLLANDRIDECGIESLF